MTENVIEYAFAAKVAGVGMGMVFMVLIAVGVVVWLTSFVVRKLEERGR